MTATQTPLDGHEANPGRRSIQELQLNPRTHGRGRVPGRRLAAFDLQAFSQALTNRDLDYQITHYASDADVRIVDPNNPPDAPLLVRGTAAIRAWLLMSDVSRFELEVSHVVDGGDRIAFTQQWRRQDGTTVLATSTAELVDGLISTQHTILASGRRRL